MIPRPAQDRAIHHRPRFLLGHARAHRTDDTEALRQRRIGREYRDHAVFLSSLEDPPHGIDRADAGCGSQVRCLSLDSASVKLDDDTRGLGDARRIRRGSIRQIHHGAGACGWLAFEKTVRYLREHHPDTFLIADAKRGDIGNTSALYARTFFEETDVDALTVAPYMGEDSVTPFLGYDGKWVVLLALTSNKGSADFQLTASADGERLFERVLRQSQEWADDERMMYVVGATQGRMFEDIRRIAPRHFLLVPGVGAQGGSLDEVCRYGMNADCGLIVNSSRAILYADRTEAFATAAAREARAVQQQMAAYL